MKFIEFLKELDLLDLKIWSYVIFWSWALAIRWIRDSNDIDIIVNDEIFDELLKKYPESLSKEHENFLNIWNLELSNTWLWKKDRVKYFIENAEIIDWHPYVELTEILNWKKSMNREKDLVDIKLIENYLKK